MTRLARFLLLFALGFCGLAAAAYPDRPITIVVPYAAGGGADPVARKIARALEQKLGTPVIVDNRPGASGMIGAAHVAKATADGYTLLYDATPFSINPHIYDKRPFANDELVPISGILFAPQLFLVPADSPIHSVQDLVREARATPGRLTYGSGGSGTVQRLTAEMFRQAFDLDMLHVPFKGGTTQALLGHQVDWIVGGVVSHYPLVKGGTIRALAISSPQRSKLLPNLPTMAESGVPGFETEEWNGLFAPAKTPPEIVRKLQDAVIEIVRSSEMQDYLMQGGVLPVDSTSPEFKDFLEKESTKWSAVVRRGGIKPD